MTRRNRNKLIVKAAHMQIEKVPQWISEVSFKNTTENGDFMINEFSHDNRDDTNSGKLNSENCSKSPNQK